MSPHSSPSGIVDVWKLRCPSLVAEFYVFEPAFSVVGCYIRANSGPLCAARRHEQQTKLLKLLVLSGLQGCMKVFESLSSTIESM